MKSYYCVDAICSNSGDNIADAEPTSKTIVDKTQKNKNFNGTQTKQINKKNLNSNSLPHLQASGEREREKKIPTITRAKSN